MFSRFEIKRRACGLWRALAVSVAMLFVFLGAEQIARAADGDPDLTFGNAGHVFTDFSGNSDYAFAIKIQPDGRIIVAGQSGVYPVFHAALARYNNNGQLDQTFGSGGKVSSTFDNRGQGYAVSVQRDGRIVLGGISDPTNSNFDFTVLRYLGTSPVPNPTGRR